MLLLTMATFQMISNVLGEKLCRSRKFLPNFINGRKTLPVSVKQCKCVILKTFEVAVNPIKGGMQIRVLGLVGPKREKFFLETCRFLSHFPYCLLLACPPCNCSTCRVTLVIRKPISDDSSGSECHRHRSSFSNTLTHSPPSSLFLPFTLLSDAKFRVWSNSPNLLRIL